MTSSSSGLSTTVSYRANEMSHETFSTCASLCNKGSTTMQQLAQSSPARSSQQHYQPPPQLLQHQSQPPSASSLASQQKRLADAIDNNQFNREILSDEDNYDENMDVFGRQMCSEMAAAVAQQQNNHFHQQTMQMPLKQPPPPAPQQQQKQLSKQSVNHQFYSHPQRYQSTDQPMLPTEAGQASMEMQSSPMFGMSGSVGGSEQQLCAMYNAQQHSDYIISDYMDKIATRINILETELKFAWRALDLMSSEYGKMWTRLEKLENISLEQKSVVANLMGLYGATSVNAKVSSAANFNQLLGEMKNEALNAVYDEHDNSMPANIYGKVSANRLDADIRMLQEQQKQIEQNIQHNEELFEELNALSYSTAAQPGLAMAGGPNFAEQCAGHAINAHTLREFLTSSNIRDGLEEGIDLVQRERMKQRYGSGGQGMEIFRNLIQNDEKLDRGEMEFFRSGEINRDLYSTPLAGMPGEMIAQNVLIDEQQQLFQAAGIFHDLNDIYLQPESVIIDHMGTSRPVSSLGMIYEDNEEQELEHQNSASEAEETHAMGDAGDKSAFAAGRKSKKRSKHKQHEIELLQNLKSAMESAADSEPPIEPVEEEKPKAPPVPPKKMTKEETIAFIIEEIGKLEDLSLFTTDQVDTIEELITKEFKFFNKINHNNKHLLLILLNPISSTDDHHYESTQHKCDELKRKLRKNMDIMKAMLTDDKDDTLLDIKPNEAIDIDEILETSSSIMDDDDLSVSGRNKSHSGSRYDIKTAADMDYYSQNLLRHNSTLNEQLKVLENKETEFMCKKSIKSIKDELEASEQNNLLDNFDEQAIIADASQFMDAFDVSHAPSMSQLSSAEGMRNDSHQYSSNSSIYSNDEYIRSLKKSLERHNSMLFLLHLQNSNYQSGSDLASSAKAPAGAGSRGSAKEGIQMIDDDRISNSSQSPPPPAPNGEDASAAKALAAAHAEFYGQKYLAQAQEQQAQSFNMTISSMNPFHADIMLMHNEMSRQSDSVPTTSHYLSSAGLGHPVELSPKKTKSDSGLSSMSGLSSLEKSPNSPCHKPRFGHYQHASSHMIHFPQASYASSNDTISATDKLDSMFSEENLNYIRELSKNVPICSAFENKSIFTSSQMQNVLQHFMDEQRPPPQSAPPFQMSLYSDQPPPVQPRQQKMKNYPDLLGQDAIESELKRNLAYMSATGSSSNLHYSNQNIRQSASPYGSNVQLHQNVRAGSVSSLHSSAAAKQQQQHAAPAKHKHLTDRLVFYPSSNNLTDYNSSMNLDFMGCFKEHERAAGKDQNVQQHHAHQQSYPHPHPQSYYVRQASSNGDIQYHSGSTGSQHSGQSRAKPPAGEQIQYNRSASVPSRNPYYTQEGGDREILHQQQQPGFHSAAAGDKSHSVASKQRMQQQQQQQTKSAGGQGQPAQQNNKYLNKFSQWLPDIKLKKISKRYRSQSLPAGAESDEEMTPPPQSAPSLGSSGKSMFSHPQPQQPQHPLQQRKTLSMSLSSSTGSPPASANSKKKKRTLVNTMSNIMQKAKIYRRHSFTHSSLSSQYQQKGQDAGAPIVGQRGGRQAHHQSLRGVPSTSRFVIMKGRAPIHSMSDPETDPYSTFMSDTDEKSAASDAAADKYGDEEYLSPQSLFPTIDPKTLSDERRRSKEVSDSDNSDAKNQQSGQKQRPSSSDVEKEYSNPNLMFQTIGDARNSSASTASQLSVTHNHSGSELSSSSTNGEKHTPSDPNANHETGDKFIFNSTSMEFAVSRKIGKYRQKNVSSDDINGQRQADGKTAITGSSSGGSGADEDINLNKMTGLAKTDAADESQSARKKQIPHYLQKTHSIFVEDEFLGKQEFDSQNDNAAVSPPTVPTSSDEAKATKSASGRHPPPPVANERYKANLQYIASAQATTQQSLDIPSREEEDNKSQHSYRTISSSRRQSTEDSIDTDDEYFCYELRKLEELERLSHMEQAGRYGRTGSVSGGGDEPIGSDVLSKIDKLTADHVGIMQYEQGGDEDMMIMYYNNDADSYQPDDDVKQKMSVVLTELKSVVETKSMESEAPKGRGVGNAYEKFAQVIDSSWQQPQLQPLPKAAKERQQRANNNMDDDFSNDFMGELNQFEFEINSERYRRHSQQRNSVSNAAAEARHTGKKVVRKKRRKRSTGNAASAANAVALEYDSDELAERYSTSPYSSNDELRRYKPSRHGQRSDSSGATSGPDSQANTDDDLDAAIAAAAGKLDINEQHKHSQQTIANSKNDDFVEATTTDDPTRLQQIQFNENSSDVISDNGGRIGSEQFIEAKRVNEESSMEQFNDDFDGAMAMERLSQEVSVDSNDAMAERSTSLETTDSTATTTATTTPATSSAFDGSQRTKMSKMLSHESSQDSTNGGFGSSKWKLLKTLKEKKIEEKNNQEKIKEEENSKDKDSVSRRQTISLTNQMRESLSHFVALSFQCVFTV